MDERVMQLTEGGWGMVWGKKGGGGKRDLREAIVEGEVSTMSFVHDEKGIMFMAHRCQCCTRSTALEVRKHMTD